MYSDSFGFRKKYHVKSPTPSEDDVDISEDMSKYVPTSALWLAVLILLLAPSPQSRKKLLSRRRRLPRRRLGLLLQMHILMKMTL